MPTHAEVRRLPHRADQMFDLVADVGRYPEFLPWCQATRIRERKDDLLVADMVIGFKIFRERFTSRVALDWEAKRVDVTYSDGPFKYLKNHWIFTPSENGQECDIDFFVDFEFRSKLLQSAISVVFNEAVTKMVNAFEGRAADLYGGRAPDPGAAIGQRG